MSRNYVTEMDTLIGDMHADLGLSRREHSRPRPARAGVWWWVS